MINENNSHSQERLNLFMAKSEESARLERRPMIRVLALPQRAAASSPRCARLDLGAAPLGAGKPKLRARSGVRMAHARTAWQSNPARRQMTAIWSDLHAGARKSIVIRSPFNEQMSTDEQMLVAALCAAQVRVPDVTRWFLADLLRADALDDACRSFEISVHASGHWPRTTSTPSTSPETAWVTRQMANVDSI